MATDSLSPQIVARVLKEIRDIAKNPVEGIEYEDNDDNSVSEIFAVITGPEETPFAGGKFRMKLVLSAEYPSVPPRGYFLTRIFHPNVSASGDICVNTLKKDWTPDVTIKHVLQVIRCLLIVPFPESSLNDEAGKLFMESYDEYARRAKLTTVLHAMEGNENISVDGNISEPLRSSSSKCAAGEELDVVEDKKKKAKDVKKKSLKRL